MNYGVQLFVPFDSGGTEWGDELAGGDWRNVVELLRLTYWHVDCNTIGTTTNNQPTKWVTNMMTGYRKNWTKADRVKSAITLARRKVRYMAMENTHHGIVANRIYMENRTNDNADWFRILYRLRTTIINQFSF